MKVAMNAVNAMKRVDDLSFSQRGGFDVYQVRREERIIVTVNWVTDASVSVNRGRVVDSCGVEGASGKSRRNARGTALPAALTMASYLASLPVGK